MINKGRFSLSVLATVGVCVGLLNSFGILAVAKDSRIKIDIQFPSERPFPIPANWKGLTPLKSTRSDVEKILGKPRKVVPGPVIYENESERVDVAYARDRCESWNGDWNMPTNTVIRIEVRPVKTVLVEDLVSTRANTLFAGGHILLTGKPIAMRRKVFPWKPLISAKTPRLCE